MKVSKLTALEYISNSSYFFPTRADRNNAFSGDDIQSGIVVAVAEDVNVDMNDENSNLWNIEVFNGANWVLQSLDGNYALTVTEEGLSALSRTKDGKYILEVSCIKVKSNNIINPETPLTSWTDINFVMDNDIVLNTANDDPNFSLKQGKTFTWRGSLSNAGIQFTLLIDSNVYGQLNKIKLEEYTIGAIGIYVKDQRETNPTGEGILFAIGNLQKPIHKYVTNAERVGNAIKLYFNLVLSNLGHVSNVNVNPEDVNSLPEVYTENDLKFEENNICEEALYQYNTYLVSNYRGTNSPAIAVRTPIDSNGEVLKWQWTFITASDNTMQIPEDSNEFDLSCKDYMVVALHKNGKFYPAHGDKVDDTTDANEEEVITGIKVNNNIIFSGKLNNTKRAYSYLVSPPNPNHKGYGYRTGDVLYTSFNGKIYTCTVTNVTDPSFGVELTSGISPSVGDVEVTTGYELWFCDRHDSENSADEAKVSLSISSTRTPSDSLLWNFPTEWLNKPLYVDYDHSGDSANQWKTYCDTVLHLDADSAERNNKNRNGYFTTEATESFVGWCTGVGAGTSSVHLALDLRNEATEDNFGTTRYATNIEVKNAALSGSTNSTRSVTPKTLQDNFIQRTRQTGNPGESMNKPVEVDTYVKFNQTIIGKGANTKYGTVDENVSFFGLAYRAWWGDLAEFYESDEIYPAGTLITIGSGTKEITKATVECNGIISDKPGYELGEKATPNHLPVALVGKVPVIFDKKCVPHFGDRVYLSRFEDGKASNVANGFCLGKVIDKRPNLENCQTVMCSVRISF